MKHFCLASLWIVSLCGCGALIDVDDPVRPRETAPVVGQLPLELTPELKAAGAIGVAAYNGPWLFRSEKESRLRDGDLLQVDVYGVPGLEKTYLEYINEEGFWSVRGSQLVKGRNRTQENVAKDFPGRFRVPMVAGLKIRVFGPYSKDCCFIGGEVKKRGYYPAEEGLTLQRLVVLAGGLKRKVGNCAVQVVRGDRVVKFPLAGIMSDSAKPFPIKPLDAVSVLENADDMSFDATRLNVPPPPPRER